MRAPSFHHPRLANEATMLGTEEILHHLPAQHSLELEQAIQQAVRQAVLHYTRTAWPRASVSFTCSTRTAYGHDR